MQMEFPIEYFQRTSPLLDSQECYHRIGVWICPHCGADFYKDGDIWEQSPYLIQVIFEPRIYKVGCITTISHCPKCNEVSWCHRDLDWFIHHLDFSREYTPEKNIPIDVDKLKEERERLIKKTKEEWERSLCARCSVKKEVERKKYNTYVKCGGKNWSRSGSPAMPDEKHPYRCKGFREVKL